MRVHAARKKIGDLFGLLNQNACMPGSAYAASHVSSFGVLSETVFGCVQLSTTLVILVPQARMRNALTTQPRSDEIGSIKYISAITRSHISMIRSSVHKLYRPMIIVRVMETDICRTAALFKPLCTLSSWRDHMPVHCCWHCNQIEPLGGILD